MKESNRPITAERISANGSGDETKSRDYDSSRDFFMGMERSRANPPGSRQRERVKE
jgi:hypothetical protein